MIRRREVMAPMTPDTRERLLATIDAMPEEMQLQVLAYAESLGAPLPRGLTGAEMRRLVGLFPHEDLKEISAAIEDGCERVDAGEW
jgi:hypothetical protein